MYATGSLPEYTEIPEPTVQNDNSLLMTVKAAAIKNLDKSRASGRHYTSQAKKENGRVIGGDGVGILADGRRVYAMGESGMMAEKAIIEKDRMVYIPDDLDDIAAAALPNAVIGSAMGFKFKADIQLGDIVLINGATGFTGTVAVQLAKIYGAKKVIATGRNVRQLQALKLLGADEIITISGDDKAYLAQIKEIHSSTPIDIVMDYLWGHTAEMIFSCLRGNGSFGNKIRYVSVGAMAGDKTQLSAEILRSINIQITGSGLGAWTKEQVKYLFSNILPEAFDLAAAGKLKIQTQTVQLKDIADLWDLKIDSGKRLVVTIDYW